MSHAEVTWYFRRYHKPLGLQPWGNPSYPDSKQEGLQDPQTQSECCPCWDKGWGQYNLSQAQAYSWAARTEVIVHFAMWGRAGRYPNQEVP